MAPVGTPVPVDYQCSENWSGVWQPGATVSGATVLWRFGLARRFWGDGFDPAVWGGCLGWMF